MQLSHWKESTESCTEISFCTSSRRRYVRHVSQYSHAQLTTYKVEESGITGHGNISLTPANLAAVHQRNKTLLPQQDTCPVAVENWLQVRMAVCFLA